MKYNDKPLINGLITSNDTHKSQFLIFILEQSSILVDLTLKDGNGNTALFEAIYNSKSYTHYIIQLLFMRGYKMNDIEASYLIEKFNSNTTRPEHLENVTMALICHKLFKPKLISKSQKIIKVIFTFLSFKMKKIIGYKLNHTALANNFLQHHQEFSTLFIRALQRYDFYEELKKKPSFTKKEQNVLENMPFQETEYDEILKIMFPELYE